MDAFNNTDSNTFKNTDTNVWGPGRNYDTQIGKSMQFSEKRKGKPYVNTGYNTQPYMASSPSYLPNMMSRSDKAIHDDLRVNYGIEIPHAYLEKPYIGFSSRNYKFMKNRKPTTTPISGVPGTGVGISDYETPGLTTPRFTIPGFTIPGYGYTIPGFTSPDFVMPEFPIPDFPYFEYPEMLGGPGAPGGPGMPGLPGMPGGPGGGNWVGGSSQNHWQPGDDLCGLFLWDYNRSAETIDADEELVLVATTATQGPYTWTVTPSDKFSLNLETTNTEVNFLSATEDACGMAIIEVTDNCSENDVIGYVRCTEGEWICQSYANYSGNPNPSECRGPIGAGGGCDATTVTEIVGDEKWVISNHACFGHRHTPGLCDISGCTWVKHPGSCLDLEWVDPPCGSPAECAPGSCSPTCDGYPCVGCIMLGAATYYKWGCS